ncbi:hypothetical protein [Clostridium thermarum]|uniref:hypothetical protein n=1 Tax=Clostridium thermarum TaxID=1716543 RepID=UPI0013D4714C|nr:hypothetical protein [Clostridium thermarum]
MTYRSMEKTNPDKMKDIDQNNPENNDTQSILSNQYNQSVSEYAKQNNLKEREPGM